MTYAAIPARLATVVAEQPDLAAMWDGSCIGRVVHVARRDVGPQLSPGQGGPPPFERGWDGSCERCGASIPWDSTGSVRLSGGCKRIWDTPSGELEPGCLYWGMADTEHYCFAKWTNCDGRHLYAILPNGSYWDIDSRAGNCTMRDDTEHRCWVRHGEPPNVHVDKAGHTCAAGAGSILAGDYHGFLHNGVFTAG